ncbi:hypothetical protein DFH06DRAFT_111874, partial [Mycena polygramma]
MSSPTTVYRLQYHNDTASAPRDRSSLPENNPIVYLAEDTRNQILAIVNSVWDEGLFITFGQLPVLLAPHSTTYRTDRCLESIRHAKKAPVLFVWLDIGSLPPLFSLPDADYAVAFFLPRVGSFQCLDLSWVVLRFMDEYIRSGNYTRFRLLSLCYEISPSGTFGVLFFDNALRTAYLLARKRANASKKNFRRRFKHPICTWPSNAPQLSRPDVIRGLMRSILALLAM